MNETSLVQVEALEKNFETRAGFISRLIGRQAPRVEALRGVGFSIARGETLGLIGESGCGKSTLARVLLRLQPASSGRIVFDGEDLLAATPARMRALRQRMQIVFQDPYASLNPRQTVEQIVGMPLRLHRRATRRAAQGEVVQMLERVGLKAAHLNRFAHQFSGGQRQRIGIARALILKPDFVVCDEPVSALDVSIQAQILHLLQSLQREFGLTYLFIGHNLSVVGYVSDRVAVMYLGQIVEIGAAREVLQSPAHPYTQSLLAAVPRLDGSNDGPAGHAADPSQGAASALRAPSGCSFHPRCPHAMAVCETEAPQTVTLTRGVPHTVACHLYHDA